ncbi:hypothetical protein AGR7A_Cc120074 [Agrobacterium deltaense NCPPB 1641]|uniref:Uncharacterized protein n=1 Tax=Agrobacterium deltaense NCPPB 1641 TaxID=1183425 RepID=A0A1S7TJ25_9HYPH|nr:hypothetical protein AGR7A_Cc120074 [Agrobacterium deltaense NCPPB 1641]
MVLNRSSIAVAQDDWLNPLGSRQYSRYCKANIGKKLNQLFGGLDPRSAANASSGIVETREYHVDIPGL